MEKSNIWQGQEGGIVRFLNCLSQEFRVGLLFKKSMYFSVSPAIFMNWKVLLTYQFSPQNWSIDSTEFQSKSQIVFLAFFFFFGKKLKCKLTTCKIMVFLCPLPAAAKLLQSCPTLCDPIDGSLPGSAIPGILQARILKWVAISFSTLPPSSC